MRLLICAGGTGGGVYPALTVLQKVKGMEARLLVGAADKMLLKDHGEVAPENLQPATINLEPLWVGSAGGMEADLVKRAHVPFIAIPAAGVHGVGIRALPRNIWQLLRGFLAARRVLRQFHPDVLLFTGGYVAVPMGLAARLPWPGVKRPRILLYVPDIQPGWALKVLARFADHIAMTVEDTRQYLPRRVSATATGYPVRPDLQVWEPAHARQVLGLQTDLPVLLVSGGSRGARQINRAVLAILPKLLPEMQIVHITGQLDYSEVESAWRDLSAQLPEELSKRYHPFAFLHQEMGAAMTVADLALARAGASILGEFPHFGLPAILVPYPHAWRYQKVNAQYLVERGAAVLLSEDDLGTGLLPAIRGLMQDRQRRLQMKQTLHTLARPQAAEQIGSIMVRLAFAGNRARI